MEYVDVYTINKESTVVERPMDYLEYAVVKSEDNSVQSGSQCLSYEVERWPVKRISHSVALDELMLNVHTETQYAAIQPELIDVISAIDGEERSWWKGVTDDLKYSLQVAQEDLKEKDYRINMHNYSGYFLRLWDVLLGRKI